jgi:hypothetical protein
MYELKQDISIIKHFQGRTWGIPGSIPKEQRLARAHVYMHKSD